MKRTERTESKVRQALGAIGVYTCTEKEEWFCFFMPMCQISSTHNIILGSPGAGRSFAANGGLVGLQVKRPMPRYAQVWQISES